MPRTRQWTRAVVVRIRSRSRNAPRNPLAPVSRMSAGAATVRTTCSAGWMSSGSAMSAP
ncbi:hypothetical protein ACR6C2_34565 [Streptomyces sp. INA 01156]